MKKLSINISGHQTSISLESEFISALHEIARTHGKSVAALIREIDSSRGNKNLSSAVRVYVLSEKSKVKSEK